MPKKIRRVLAIGDFHCGHRVGLTPPYWQRKAVKPSYKDEDLVETTKRAKWTKLQGALWKEWTAIRKKAGKIDVLLVNGDCIDGRSEKNGGKELIINTRDEQCDMAAYIIRQIGADKIIMTYGTNYHVGSLEDWENNIASAVKAAKIGAHEWFDVNGVVFDAKHKVGTSGIPHGRATALLKADLWNIVWADQGMQPRADVVVRSHAHYSISIRQPDGQCVILPALQGMGSDFGARQCEGTVHFGACWWDVTDKDNWDYHPEVRKIEAQKTAALVL